MCSCPAVSCCVWYLLHEPCKCSLYLQYQSLNTQHVGSSSCLSHMCSSFQITRRHGRFQGVGRDLVESWHSSVLGRTLSRLTAERGEAKCAPLSERASAQLWGGILQAVSPVLGFLCAHLCLHWWCVTLQTCLSAD